MTQPIAITAPVGPNPAAISELVWHLVRREGVAIRAIHLVLESQRSLDYVHTELLGPGRALDELRDLLGPAVPKEDRIVLHRARTEDGLFPPNERHPDVASAMSEPLWTAARQAQAEVGDAPVWFGLTGGRRRVSTASQTMVFQLLGRPQDHLVDVRVSLPAASGGSGFLFPEQTRQELRGRFRYDDVRFEARDVDVWVERLHIPRLRPLLAESDLRTYADAALATEQKVQHASPPRVTVDLRKGAITVDGAPLVLSGGQLAAYLLILVARARGEADVSSVDQDRLRHFLGVLPTRSFWSSKLREWMRAPDPEDIGDLKERHGQLQQVYSRMRTNLRKRLKTVAPGREQWLVPKSVTQGGQTTQRLSLPPDCITIQVHGDV